MRKRFTQEFKQDAVSQVTEKGFPVAEVSERLGVSSHSLYKWVRQYSKHGVGSAGKLNASAEEIQRLADYICYGEGVSFLRKLLGERIDAPIKQVVGPKGWSTDADTVAPYLADQRGLFQGDCAMLVRPGSTQAVAEVVKLCAEAGIAIVPQGGNTGLVGAGIPNSTAVLISLGRMNKVRDIDPLDYTITVEAKDLNGNVTVADIEVTAPHDRRK